MKNSLIAAAGLAIAATSFAAPADAGPFDKLKRSVKKAEKAANEVDEAAETVEGVADAVENGRLPTASGYSGSSSRRNYPKTASRGNFKGVAGAVPTKYTGMTSCANVGLGNAFIANTGTYTFSQGLNTEERTGLLDRRNVSASNGCVLPAMGSGDVLYVEVDRAKYNAGGDYVLQCVSYDGKEQLSNSTRPPENNYTGKDVMLHTGHSLSYTPTASGSNSSRSGAYDKLLKSRGREMITFNMPNLHTDKSGTDFYCQHYNKQTNKSALAFAFRRGPVSR